MVVLSNSGDGQDNSIAVVPFTFTSITEQVEFTTDKILSISLRSRKNFDVSEIAKEIGGGGHKMASGAKVEGLPFDEAVEKVLAAARKYAQKTS